MKKILTILALALSLSCGAQRVEQKGKTFVITQKDAKPVNTGYTITVEGKSYPIYKGVKGGYFYIKDGKKVYVPKEVRKQLEAAGV